MARRRPPRRMTGRPLVVNQSVESRGGREWYVRRLTGATSAKTYTCPGCHRAIEPGTAHLVAWPTEPALLSASGVEERRHWHTACWSRGG